MSSDDLSMKGAFVDSNDNATKKPVIFAGSIFYKHVHDSLKLAQVAMLTRNFEQWTVILLDLNSKLTPFMQSEEVEVTRNNVKTKVKTPDKIEYDLQNCLSTIMINGNTRDSQTSMFLLKALLSAQKQMFASSSALFIGLTEKGENEFERDQEDGG